MDTSRGPEISRRGFLLGIASLPVAQEAFAAEEPDSDTDLIFDLSPDEATVRVVRVARPLFDKSEVPAGGGKKPADLSRQWKVWEIQAAAFGKDAFFDLEPRTHLDKDLEAAHALAVRGVSYGELSGGTIIFRFYESNQGGRHWRVGMITDIWHSEKGGRKQYHVGAKDGQPLSEMAKADDKARLSMTLTPARVNKTFELLADGLIRCEPGIPTVAIDGAMNWHVDGVLSGFDGRARLGALTFGWQQDPSSASTLAAEPSTESLFLATGKVVTIAPLAMGTSKDLPLTIHADSKGEAANFTLIGRTRKLAGFSSRDPSQSGPQAAAVAWIEPLAGQITTEDSTVSAPARSFARLPFHEASISQTFSLSSAGNPIRTAFWGQAGQIDKPRSSPHQDPGDDAVGEVKTRIGRIRYRQVPAEARSEAPQSLRTKIGKIISAALGDRSGVLQSTLYAVGDGRPAAIRRFSADLHVVGLDAALPDVQDSELKFDPTLLRLAFTDGGPLTAKPGVPFYEHALAEPPAFIWLGAAAAGRPVARFDLLRAALKARSDRDLVDLTFRFADMSLDFTSVGVGYQTQVKPRSDDCGVRSAVDGTVIDNRPILSVEFAPQHVMEEAFFRLEPPPLPDGPTFLERGDLAVTKPPEFMESAAAVLARLGAIPDEEGRRNFRLAVQTRKIVMEDASRFGASTPSPLTFKHFTGLFGAAAKSLPQDQQVYIGPLGLDPDGMEIARREQEKVLFEALAAVPETAEKEALDLLSRRYPEKGGNSVVPDLTEALRREREIESELPVYRLWRDCWRDTVLDLPGNQAPLEWLMDGNRLKDGKLGSTADKFDKATKDKALKLMIDRLSGQEEIPELAKARFSGPTFLAFHINCTPSAQDDPEANCLPAASSSSPQAPGGLGTSFSAFPFTFEALTDWSHHEPAVTRRARSIYSPTAAGELPPVADRAADLDLNKMLVFQGISEGPHQIASQRMREIQASVNEIPAPFETHIELPSRVILSTAQDAVWSTKRRRPLPGRPTGSNVCKAPSPSAQKQDPGQMPRSEVTAEPLWSARLMTTDGLRGLKPGVRVIDSPDFRPGALSRSEYPVGNETDRIPGEASPPRGKYAPWTIGRDEWDGGMQAQFCKPEQQGGTPRTGLIGWICTQFDIRSKLPDDVRFFRSSLDAYDRHELVLLSSTYGLPILPAGIAAGGSQFKPNPEFLLIDGTGEQAVYVPKTLDLNELTLTALGGSLDHDTIFVPPAPARGSVSGKALFDGLSIERWQHRTVLGRDIIATVVYSGFLFPFGHKASLVKVTERVFHRSKSGEIKAPLRQRMFIRISDPDKNYPAVGQPNEGRRWCGRTVKLITKTTPDIVDPMVSTTGSASNTASGDADLNGRLKFSGSTGLAFWPKTSLSEGGLVSFDLEIDGRTTSLPLIFVDKTTTQDSVSVKTVVDHYNSFSDAPRAVGSEDARCKVRMGGQTLDFAPSKVSGDTTFATDTIILRAEGRYGGEGTVSWAQNNSEYANIQALESAAQPPFYPLLGAAHIRIEQVETLTGETGRSVRVKYDGHYVRNGFASDQSTNTAAVDNPAEVFLCVADTRAPRLGMGAKGEQAGALAQPNTTIAALGRKSGPLGGTTPSYSLGPGLAAKNLAVEMPAGDARAPAEHMFSLAKHFSMGTTTPAEAGEANTAASTTYKDFFSEEAKLLGVIKLKDLIDFLDISGATDALPILKEAVEFGTEALANLQSRAGHALGLVRREILVPLRELTRRIREQWADLDRRLVEKQRGLDTGSLATGPLSVKTIYPEIDAGLTSLEQALDHAIANEDPVLALARLAGVHEAGKRLVRQLAVIASNPVERVEAEIRRRIDAFTADVSRLVNVVVSQFRTWADAVKATLTEQIYTLVDELLEDGTDALLAFLGLPLPLEIIDRAANTIADAKAAAIMVDNLRPLLGRLDAGSIKTTVRDQLKAVQDDPTKAEAAVIGICEAIYQRAKTQLVDARAELEKSNLSNALKEEVLVWLDAYGVEIERLLKAIQVEGSDLLVGSSDTIEQVIAAKQRLARILGTIKRLTDSRDEKDVRREVLRIAGDWIGADLARLSRLVADTIAKAIRPWASGVRTRVQAFFGETLPRLPGGAGAFALAGDLEKSAQLIGSSGGDPMADFARMIVQSADTLVNITEVRNGIPSQVPELIKQQLVKTCDELAESIRATQRIFQTTTLLRHHAENTGDRLETLLKAIDDELATGVPDSGKLAGLVTAFGDEFRRVGSTEKTLFAAFVQDTKILASSISRQAGFIGLVALAGALSDALKGTGLEARSQAVKDFADRSEKELARWTLRCVKWVSASAASLVDPSSNLTGQLSILATNIREAGYLALFDPERGELASRIDDLGGSLSLATVEINEFTTAVVSLDESIAFTRLVEILRPIIVERPLDQKLLQISTSASRVTINASQFASRVRGLPGLLEARAEKVLADAEQYALQRLKEILGVEANKLQAKQTEILNTADPWAAILVDQISSLHTALVDNRDKVYREFTLGAGAFLKIKQAIVVGSIETGGTPEPLDDLRREQNLLSAVQATRAPLSNESARQQLRSYLESYGADSAALQKLGRQIRDVAEDLERGDLLTLIDVAALREEIEERISELVPLKRTLKYELDFAFKELPKNPIAEIFKPKRGGRFSLEMAATIDLLKFETKMTARGRIDAFDIELVGGFIDALTLSFEGAEFSFDGGGSAKFDVFYRDFKIGPALQFIQELQAWLKPNKDGSGFFIEPARGVPGIKAGYGISLPIIMLGNVSFSNISLNTAVILPFDGSEALFEISLGRPASLFRIAASPYAGGGFLAVTANVDGVKGFEMSLAFGGGGAFQAGPLVGQGFIDTGIYIRTMTLSNGKRITDLYGTFYAGGSASIWIFHFAASLYVRLGMTGGTGSMEGVAIFTFSFSMGIVDYDYRCEMRKSQEALGGGSTQSIAPDHRPSRAPITIDHDPNELIDPMVTDSTTSTIDRLTRTKRKTKGLEQDPNTFMDYFDLLILQKA